MSSAIGYLWEHVVALIALATSMAHIVFTSASNRKRYSVALSSSVEKIIPIILTAIKNGADFESGKPMTLPIPSETITLDFTAEGFGKVTITESGGTVQLQKAP